MHKLQFPVCLLTWSQDAGCRLNALLSDANASPKPKRSLLPLLTVVFLISYGLLTLLVVQQNEVIASQRNLIRLLLGDSNELSSLKGKLVQEQSRLQPPPPPPQTRSQAQPPDSQVPQGGQAKNNNGARNHNNKMSRPLPQRPPKVASDTFDERRELVRI